MRSGKSWFVIAALLVALPFGAGQAMAGEDSPPRTRPAEIVVGTVGQDGTRTVPTTPGAPTTVPDLERGVVPDSPA